MQETNKNYKEKNRLIFNPVEKRLNLTARNIIQMLEKIHTEIHILDVEWLQLKALANPSKNTDLNVAEVNTNFDDVSTINALECNFEPIPNLNAPVQQSSESESEESEMDEDFNVFI